MGWLKHKTTVVMALAGVVAVVAAGAAFALGGDRGEREQEMLADVATSLGVEQAALEQAIRDAQTGQVDAAETDGTLTGEQADRIRERIDTGQTRLLAAPGRGHHRGGLCRGFGKNTAIEAAAGALDLTASELRELLPGSSIKAVAEDKGVAVGDVTAAIVTVWETRIDQAAADGKISQERATNLKDRLAEKANQLVECTFPEHGAREGKRGFGKHGNRGLGPQKQQHPRHPGQQPLSPRLTHIDTRERNTGPAPPTQGAGPNRPQPPPPGRASEGPKCPPPTTVTETRIRNTRATPPKPAATRKSRAKPPTDRHVLPSKPPATAHGQGCPCGPSESEPAVPSSQPSGYEPARPRVL